MRTCDIEVRRGWPLAANVFSVLIVRPVHVLTSLYQMVSPFLSVLVESFRKRKRMRSVFFTQLVVFLKTFFLKLCEPHFYVMQPSSFNNRFQVIYANVQLWRLQEYFGLFLLIYRQYPSSQYPFSDNNISWTVSIPHSVCSDPIIYICFIEFQICMN